MFDIELRSGPLTQPSAQCLSSAHFGRLALVAIIVAHMSIIIITVRKRSERDEFGLDNSVRLHEFSLPD